MGKVINVSHRQRKQGGRFLFLLISVTITILVDACNNRIMEESGNGVDACNSVHCCTSCGHMQSGFCTFWKVCVVQWLQQMDLEITSLMFPHT